MLVAMILQCEIIQDQVLAACRRPSRNIFHVLEVITATYVHRKASLLVSFLIICPYCG